MSQFGMQLPGGRARRGASLDVYTGLAFLAVIALGTACAMMWIAGTKVGVSGAPFELQRPGEMPVLKKTS